MIIDRLLLLLIRNSYQFHPLSEDKFSQQLLCIFIAINFCQDYILK